MSASVCGRTNGRFIGVPNLVRSVSNTLTGLHSRVLTDNEKTFEKRTVHRKYLFFINYVVLLEKHIMISAFFCSVSKDILTPIGVCDY